MADTYRLITRSDFDGLMCAVLLKQKGLISDEIDFVHPKDMQDGKVEVDDKTISANLPYVEGVHLCFDHHASEVTRVGEHDNQVIDPDAPARPASSTSTTAARRASGTSTKASWRP